ncbi:MAG: hypothetical protein CBD16_07555 [Betaproteobacteria bacterium TMED156]|nr:MAG: hypothetical protein CBD16_07555 [Betaproteobacteria bacterium TMED156]|tara:strand:- start:592 stop:915 length:324 start_codon:yes stop_codon:yes gene_type:complete
MLFRVFFKDAYKWYSAKLLQAYDNDTVKPRTKRKKFSTLKRKAPKVPEYTCPQIDQVLDHLSSDTNIKGRQFTKIKNKMEKLRTQNELLRESGIYWYEIAKGILGGK